MNPKEIFLEEKLYFPSTKEIFLEEKLYFPSTKSEPDYMIELYWFGFKQSMINFYTIISKKCDHIIEWSNTLNKYKSNKDYMNIEHSIREYMSFYSFDLIKYSKCIYHDNILIKNIKRWNEISTTFNFNKSVKHTKIVILFMIYLQIKISENFNFLNNIRTIEEILESNNYDEFIIYSFNNMKSKILGFLKEIPEYNIYENIRRLYPTINIKDNLSPIKIIQIVKKNLIK